MAVASGRLAAPAAYVPAPRWRSRPMQVAGIVVLILLGYALFRGEFSWPASLTWQELPERLDDAQTWLLEQRTAENPNVIFAILDGFRALAEWLVTAIDNMLLWLTWVGTIAASVLIVLRFGGWRAALIVLFAFVSFALMGLWEESLQTLALMSAAVLLSLFVGVPIGIVAGRSDGFYRAITPALDAMQIVPAFAYLMPIVILFSVGPGGGRDLHDDLRDPARRAHHGARHPRGHLGRGRGGERVRLDPRADPLQGPAAAGSPPDPAGAQPDDHVRALAGRDRRPDRRPRPRRRRDQRPLLERRARDPRRHSDRDHGDRARSRHLRDRGPH